MVDTIITSGELQAKDKVQFINRLDKINEHKKYDKIYTRGKIGSLNVNIAENKVSILGSLPKFYFGNNIEELDFETLQHSITKLKDTARLNFKDFRLNRIDLEKNFELANPVSDYLPIFSRHPKLRKSEFFDHTKTGETVQFRGTDKKLIFYNKIKECGDDVPTKYRDRNILRSEVQFNKKLKRHFNSKVNFNDLERKNFYSVLTKKWADEVKKIQLVDSYIINPSSELSVKNLVDGLIAIGIKSRGGVQNIFTSLDAARTPTNSQKILRLKNKLVRLCDTNFFINNTSNYLEVKKIINSIY